jgi:hypothetical protein
LEVEVGAIGLSLRLPKIPTTAKVSTAMIIKSKTSGLKRRELLTGAGGISSALGWLTGFEAVLGLGRVARDAFFLFDDFFLLAIFLL